MGDAYGLLLSLITCVSRTLLFYFSWLICSFTSWITIMSWKNRAVPCEKKQHLLLVIYCQHWQIHSLFGGSDTDSETDWDTTVAAQGNTTSQQIYHYDFNQCTNPGPGVEKHINTSHTDNQNICYGILHPHQSRRSKQSSRKPDSKCSNSAFVHLGV